MINVITRSQYEEFSKEMIERIQNNRLTGQGHLNDIYRLTCKRLLSPEFSFQRQLEIKQRDQQILNIARQLRTCVTDRKLLPVIQGVTHLQIQLAPEKSPIFIPLDNWPTFDGHYLIGDFHEDVILITYANQQFWSHPMELRLCQI